MSWVNMGFQLSKLLFWKAESLIKKLENFSSIPVGLVLPQNKQPHIIVSPSLQIPCLTMTERKCERYLLTFILSNIQPFPIM